jgi:carbonic anhydrase/acetyltransferase-like protein (isoleucine patch superfamily)
MAHLIELDGVSPTIGDDVFLAPTAVLIGDVRIGPGATVWFGAVLRGDFSHVAIGAGTHVQDNCVLHCAEDLPTIVRERVTVGHGAMLEGCVVEDDALIGMGAVVLQRARVGAGAVLAAGSVLAEGAMVAPRTLAAGAPAREKKPLSGSAEHWAGFAAGAYDELRARYVRGAHELTHH